MADETIVNGEALGRDELFVDFDDDDDTNQKIAAAAALQQEKSEDRFNKLKEVVEVLEREKADMKREIEQSEADKRSLESIAARAAQLETEVSRLQHDLISSTSEAEDANSEILELKRAVADLKKSDSEKGSKVEILDKERNLLLERLEREAEVTKDLQNKIETLEEAKVVLIAEKETEIQQLNKCIEEMDSLGAHKGLEIERLNKEREELEIVKNQTEALLKKSERKVKEMEKKVAQLQLELEAAERTITMSSGLLKENTLAIEGGLNGNGGYQEDRGGGGGGGIVEIENEDEEDGLMGLKKVLPWPIVAASAGAFTAVAVVYYLRYGKQR